MQPGPFASAALDLARLGLAVIPVGGPDGKKPLVRWQGRKALGRPALAKLAERHGEANVGILCGLSRLTIVDIDDITAADRMIARCGSTPLVTETPSGGLHFWYRCAGEKCADLRGEGLAVDVKAEGGFIVVPPSVRPAGPHAGKIYRFVQGGWDDLARLPTVTPGSLRLAEFCLTAPRSSNRAGVAKGCRNNALFKNLLRHARGCDSFELLLDVAHGINENNSPPLDKSEVERVVQSVWEYESTGSNWSGKEARAVITASELSILIENPDALALRTLLQVQHGCRVAPFAVSPVALAREQYVPGWGSRRYAATRQWLVDRGFLRVIHQGGSGPGDAWLFRLATPIRGREEEGCSLILDTPKASLSRPPRQARRSAARMRNAA